MNNYKYSLKLQYKDSLLAQSFLDKLKEIGYQPATTKPLINRVYIVVNNCSNTCPNGTFNVYLTTKDADFEFYIDNKWEYEAALAIAAIRDDNKPYVGEWVIGTFSEKLEKGKWAKIIEVENRDHIYRGFNIDKISTKDWQLNIDGYYCRKATPEEIIQYMKEKYMFYGSIPTLPEKWCIKSETVKDKEDFVNWLCNDRRAKTGNNTKFSFPGFHHYPYNGKGYTFSCRQWDQYTLITYEQWKQWYDYNNKETMKEQTIELPKEWSVNCKSSEEAREVVNYALSIGTPNPYDFVGSNSGNYGIKNGRVAAFPTRNHFPTIEEWRKVFKPETIKDKKIIGYKLIKEYPGSPDLGKEVKGKYFGHDISGFPHLWQPIYEEEIKEKVLIIGSQRVKVTIKPKNPLIYFDNTSITIYTIEDWYKRFTNKKELTTIKDIPLKLNLETSRYTRFIEFGCTLLSLSEIKQVIDTYNELNN